MAMAGSQGAGHEDERAKYCCKEIREPASCLLLLEGTVESSRLRAEGPLQNKSTMVPTLTCSLQTGEINFCCF